MSSDFLKYNILKILTLIVSIAAIFIAINSNSISNDALKLAQEQDIEEKTATWSGSLIQESNVEEFQLVSNNQDIILQKADLYFPLDIIGNRPLKISSPNNSLITAIKMTQLCHLFGPPVTRK